MPTTSTIFITATEARQNPIRERVVHDEGRSIESAILTAVEDGLYQCIVSDGTPMTQSTPVSSPVIDVNPINSTFFVPNHGFKQGDLIKASSTGSLPAPLTSTAYYYVIYVDPNNIKLADSLQNALSDRPIPITVSNGINNIDVVDQGDGYFVAPTVTITGGNPTTQGSALAYLGKYGSVSAISVITGGNGYTDVPTVDIVAQGAGAAAGAISYKAVGVSVSAAGSNYRIGDTLVVVGGTGIATSAKVATVGNSGNVLAVTLESAGSYTALPTLSGVSTSVSPGGGIGCTLNLVMGIANITVNTGGSGYTAQPKIVISGGDGTDAEATGVVVAGTMTGITITNPGYGYESTPTVSITSGMNATAIAILTPTSISNITVTNGGGLTYTNVPNVTIESQGVGALAGQAYMRVSSAKKISSGIGYVAGDVLLVAGGAGSTGATIQVLSVGVDGQIDGYVLITGGLYRQIPILDNNSVMGGTGTAATFDLTMCLDSVDIANTGSGYLTPPTVTVVSSTGYGAHVVSDITAGAVTSLNVIANGTGFQDIPSIVIGNGSGAIALAHLTPTGIFDLTVTLPGYAYTNAEVSFVGDGVGATATAQLDSGTIVGIILDTPGSGYTYPPAVVITGDGEDATARANIIPTSVAYVEITNGGSEYTGPPTITLEGAATAISYLSSTSVNRIDVTEGGQDYTSNPIISVIPGPRQIGVPISPSTSVTRGFSVESITVVASGTAYQSTPNVLLSAPQDLNGNTATATASIGIGQGSMTITLYPSSRDYFAAWKGYTMSSDLLIRPYVDRMDTIVSYFTDMGYTINRQTNPATNTTLQWSVKW